MAKLKLVSGKKLIAFLLKKDFNLTHQRGSHVYLTKENKIICIPVHSNKDLGRGLLLKILKDAEISKEDYERNI